MTELSHSEINAVRGAINLLDTQQRARAKTITEKQNELRIAQSQFTVQQIVMDALLERLNSGAVVSTEEGSVAGDTTAGEEHDLRQPESEAESRASDAVGVSAECW